MKWDEERFGLEYDLDIYNIVAVKAGAVTWYLMQSAVVSCRIAEKTKINAGLQHGCYGEQKLECLQHLTDLSAWRHCNRWWLRAHWGRHWSRVLSQLDLWGAALRLFVATICCYNFLPEKNWNTWNHRKAGPYPSCEVDLAWSPHDSLRSVDSSSLMLSVTVMKLETFLWVLCSCDSGDSGDFAFFSCVLHCFQKFYGDSFKTVFLKYQCAWHMIWYFYVFHLLPSPPCTSTIHVLDFRLSWLSRFRSFVSFFAVIDRVHFQGLSVEHVFTSLYGRTGNRVTCRDWFQLTLKERLWPRQP